MYPDQTIEDQKINAMHAALERARGFLKQRATLCDWQDFTVHLCKPKFICYDGANRYECAARVTVRSSTVM